MSFKMLGKILLDASRVICIQPSTDSAFPKRIYVYFIDRNEPIYIEDQKPEESIAAFLSIAEPPDFNERVEAAVILAISNNHPLRSAIQRCVDKDKWIDV